ncbi:MAG: DUF4271 domain-containing protein [Saprospiraceae bacterium]
MLKLILVFFLVSYGSLSQLTGQNPFDIKAPVNKSNTSQTKPQEKPVPPPQEAVKQETPKENQPTQPTSTQTVQPSSSNVFEIKPGANTKVVPPGVPEQNNNPALQSQVKKDSPVQTKTLPNTTSASRSSGVQDGSNPFNIVPPKTKQNNTPVQEKPPPPTVIQVEPSVPPVTSNTPDLNQLKNNLDKFKESTLQQSGTISKNAWFVIYIFLFLLAAVAINFNRSYPMALIRATYNQNQLRILFKDAFKGNQILIFGILYLLFIINGGIFLYLSFRIFEVAHISLFLAIGIVFLVYLVRHIVLHILGFTFPLTKEAMLFSYTIGLHNLALGLALMLINILLSFVAEETGKMLIFSGLSIVGMMYILRQARGLLNNMPLIISGKFHFIIYLCTVEIAPWLLLTGILLR